jgi:integrase
VARKGIKPVSKSFQTKQDAERWARQVEADIDKGSYTNVTLAERTLLKDVIERYIQEVTNQTRSMVEDRYRLGAMMRHWIGSLTMIQLTPAKVAQYRDERLKKVSAGAVIRELAYISSIINHSRREWGINMTNPMPFVKKPPSPQGRSRILTSNELERLLKACTPRVKNGNYGFYLWLNLH